MRVFFDVDGVICDLVGYFLKKYNATHGTSIRCEDVTSYEFHEWLPISRGDVRRFLGEADYITSVAYEESVVDLVSRMAKDERNTVAILTAPIWSGGVSISSKRTFLLGQFGPDMPVVMTKDKWLLANENSVLIDDHPDNINAFVAAGGHGILYPQPWNKAEKRVDMIKYIEDEVERIRGISKRPALGAHNTVYDG